MNKIKQTNKATTDLPVEGVRTKSRCYALTLPRRGRHNSRLHGVCRDSGRATAVSAALFGSRNQRNFTVPVLWASTTVYMKVSCHFLHGLPSLLRAFVANQHCNQTHQSTTNAPNQRTQRGTNARTKNYNATVCSATEWHSRHLHPTPPCSKTNKTLTKRQRDNDEHNDEEDDNIETKSHRRPWRRRHQQRDNDAEYTETTRP